MRLRDIAASVGIADRGAYGIVADLTAAGYVVKQEDSRRNRDRIQAHLPLPEPVRQEPAIGEVLALLVLQPEIVMFMGLGLLAAGSAMFGRGAGGAAASGTRAVRCQASRAGWMIRLAKRWAIRSRPPPASRPRRQGLRWHQWPPEDHR
jgi:hypothetical protein